MGSNSISLLLVSIASFLNIFSFGYLPNFLFEGFILVQSIFTYFLSISSRKKYKLPHSISYFLIINFIFLLIASLVQSSFYPISRSIALSLGITSFYFLGDNISKKKIFLFIQFLTICFFVGLFLSLYSENLVIFQYRGFFKNPNNLGRFFSYFFIIFFPFLIKFRKEINLLFSIQIYTVIIGSFVFMSFSSARAAILSSILPIVLYLICLFFKKIKILWVKKRKSDLKVLIAVVFFIFILIICGKFYYDFVNTKSVFKILQRGDFTGGRIMIWNFTIAQISNWGVANPGANNFLEYIGNDPHNTFLNFALMNGLIPAIFYFLSLFYLILKETFFQKKNKFNYLFVFSLSIATFSYWMFESANAILPFWLIFFFLAFEKKENKFI